MVLAENVSRGLTMVVRVCAVLRNWLGDLGLEHPHASGGDYTGEGHIKNPMFGLNWLCLAMVLLKALF